LKPDNAVFFGVARDWSIVGVRVARTVQFHFEEFDEKVVSTITKDFVERLKGT